MLPQPVHDRVTNFFGNLGDVWIAANNLLQGKMTDGVARHDAVRHQSTIFGVGGLFDVGEAREAAEA